MIRLWTRALVRGLIDLVYPRVCLACDRLLDTALPDLCASCRAALLDDTRPCCPRCASTLGENIAPGEDCARCRGQDFAFARVVRLGSYEGLRRELVLRMKHISGEGLAEAVGTLWGEARRAQLRALGAQVVMPIPLHWRRRWQRGFNQAAVLARCLAEQLQLPGRERDLRRVRATPLLSGVPASSRPHHLRDALRCHPHPLWKNKTILLVDDVMTTGSTAHAAARVLRAAGAERVVLAVLTHDRAR